MREDLRTPFREGPTCESCMRAESKQTSTTASPCMFPRSFDSDVSQDSEDLRRPEILDSILTEQKERSEDFLHARRSQDAFQRGTYMREDLRTPFREGPNGFRIPDFAPETASVGAKLAPHLGISNLDADSEELICTLMYLQTIGARPPAVNLGDLEVETPPISGFGPRTLGMTSRHIRRNLREGAACRL